MINQAVSVTEGRRIPWFQRFGIQIASIVILGVAVLSLVYAFVPTITSAALLQIDPSPAFVYNAHEGDVVVANFVVKNITSKPVKLLGIKAGCSCTVGEGLPLELPSGKSGEVRLNIRVGHFDKTNTISRSAEILANRDGMVPPLVVQVSESGAPPN